MPFSLLVFGLEMHYSSCPWLDDFYRAEVLRRDFYAVEKYFDTQCGINGWALAGVCFYVIIKQIMKHSLLNNN